MTTVLYTQLKPEDISFGGSSNVKRCKVIHVEPKIRVQTPVVTCMSDVEIPRVNGATDAEAQSQDSTEMKRKRRMAFTCDDRAFLDWLSAVDTHVVGYLQANKNTVFDGDVQDAVITHALRRTVTDEDTGTFVVGISESMSVFDKSRKQVSDTNLQPGTRVRLILALNQIAWGKTILTIKYIVRAIKLEDIDVSDPGYTFVEEDNELDSVKNIAIDLDEISADQAPQPQDKTQEPELDNEEMDVLFAE